MFEFKMRKLKGSDYGPLSQIIGKIDIMDDLVELFANQEKIDVKDKTELDRIIQDRGVKIMSRLLKKIFINLEAAQDDIFDLLADVCGITPKDIAEMDFVEFRDLIIEFLKKPEIKGFFDFTTSSKG